MTKATLGFIYTPSLDQVLLINKNRPAWQAGKINGLGGKVEADETGVECLVREIKEETNLEIPAKFWKKIGNIQLDSWEVEIFTCVYEGDSNDVQSVTDEIVEWFLVSNLPKNIMSNLSWLIPLGVDVLTNAIPPTVRITYPPQTHD